MSENEVYKITGKLQKLWMLKHAREQFLIAATAQNLKRLVRFLGGVRDFV